MAADEIEGLPDALTSLDQWVCWRREERDGKTTKVPVEPSTGEYASTTDQDTWSDFETALKEIGATDADGVGFVFTDDDPLVGIDLDDCRDPDSGTIDDWARDVVTRVDSYAEVSPSGTGVHVLAEGELPEGRSRKGDIEMYETSRFFTVTGDHLDATPRVVERRVDAIRGAHEDHIQDSDDDNEESRGGLQEGSEVDVDLDDEELLERARSAKNGDRFAALWRGETAGYDSHSEADMALCLHLAFWTGGDPARMDALFRQSGLLREKWDAVHYADGATYGERTVERALEMVEEVYKPKGDSDGGDAGTRPSGTTDESGAREQAPQAPSAQRDESVYLQERNRLLREKVQSQAATIERQRDRIDQLEQKLDIVRAEMAARQQIKEGDTTDSSRWNRLATWLGDS
jgi:primase-polymerase (primpol)-like protein